jgi:hypothetical protein
VPGVPSRTRFRQGIDAQSGPTLNGALPVPTCDGATLPRATLAAMRELKGR